MRLLLALLDAAQAARLTERLTALEPQWDVQTERDGRRAVDRLTSERFDLLLLHAFLPSLDGAAILVRLPLLACPPRTLLLCEPELPRIGLADCVVPIASEDARLCRLLSTLSRRPVPRAACCARERRAAWIVEALDALSLPSAFKGRAYIAWMLERLAPSPALEERIVEGLYALCAEAFAVTPASVERCVRHAVEHVFTCGDLRAIEALFGCTVDPERGKPTNRAFLWQLAERLRAYSLAVSCSPNKSEMHHSPAAPTSV